MNLSKVRRGDTVLINKRGRRFAAKVEEIRNREVSILPIDSRWTYFQAKSTEVVKVLERGPLWKRKPYKTKPTKPKEI